jgi:hypothetical protein
MSWWQRGGTTINIFRSEAAPYFLALLVSAIGWFATSIAEQTNARAVAVYSIEPRGERIRFRIENISRSATMKAAQFLFVCVDNRPACFRLAPDRLPEREIAAPPPLYIRDITPSGGPGSLVLVATLVPNSTLDVTLSPEDPKAPVTFRSVPVGDAPQDILFLRSDDIVAMFLKHYFRILILAFVTTGALLALLVIVNLVSLVVSYFTGGPKDVSPSKHDVTLRLDDGGAP